MVACYDRKWYGCIDNLHLFQFVYLTIHVHFSCLLIQVGCEIIAQAQQNDFCIAVGLVCVRCCEQEVCCGLDKASETCVGDGFEWSKGTEGTYVC